MRNAACRPLLGGCSVAEDPELDARQVQPLWATGTDDLLQVRPASAHTAMARQAFSLWRIPGRKRLAHAGSQLIITAEHGPYSLRAALTAELEEGGPCSFAIPLDTQLRMRLSEYQAQARAIRGEVHQPSFRRPSRNSLLHLRALQALDAAQAGARHRDIAEALFGLDAMRSRWSADGELRAQVRHLIARAEGLMRGGYLALAGVHRWHVPAPGDEPLR